MKANWLPAPMVICEFFILKCDALFVHNTCESYFDEYRYKGTFYGQDVAIKVLRMEHLNENLRREFTQEVNIMRSVQSQFAITVGSASSAFSFP